MDELGRLLRDWERWSADLLESHLSYPVLCYYRSQHTNQSWLALARGSVRTRLPESWCSRAASAGTRRKSVRELAASSGFSASNSLGRDTQQTRP